MKKLLLVLTFLSYSLLINAQNYDMTISSITMDDYAELSSAPFNLSAIARNIGSQTINSFDLYVSINGENPAIYSYSGLNIAQGTNYNLLRLNAFDPPKPGKYSLKLWISNLNNGNADENNANDTLSKNISGIDRIVQRNSFHEVFTSSTCPPCRPGNTVMHNVWNNTSQTPVYLKYQMDFPGSGDPYYTNEIGQKDMYYGISAVPTAMIDGKWKGNSNSYTSSILDGFSAKPAFVELQSNYSVNGKTVTIELTIKPLTELSGNNKLRIGIFEYTTFNNIKSNGESVFYNVLKKFVPSADGITLGDLKAGDPSTFEFTYTFQGNYRLPANANSPINHNTEHSVEGFNDLGVAVWVQDHGYKDVMQSIYATNAPTNVDLEFASISTPDMIEVNSNTPVSGVVVNNQSSPVTSFDVVYQIDGGSELRESVSGVNLQKGDSYTFTHNTPWQPSSLGVYKLDVRIDNINGAGVNTSDDLSLNDGAFKYIDVVQQVSGINNEFQNAVKVYPNPSNGLITINSMVDNLESVGVFTLLGEKVTTFSIEKKGVYDINLSDLPSGMYVLRFNSKNGSFSKTIVKE